MNRIDPPPVARGTTCLPIVSSAHVAAIAALAVALSATSCKKAAPPAPAPPVVQVIEVGATNAQRSAEFIGQLDSPQNVQVRARVEAFVEKILFTEGTEVKEGDPLFLLDKKPFTERLHSAQAYLAEAIATLNKYSNDVSRLTPLAKERAIPRQDLDNAIASVEIGKANVLSGQARVISAQLDLDYCEVRAPITGLIGAKQVSIGELVGKGEPTLLATMSSLDPIYFYCAVGEVQYLRAEMEVRRTGKQIDKLPVALILSDGTIHKAIGRFVFIDRAVDPKTGTLRVRAEFKNEDKLLRPGMFARIKIDLGSTPDSVLIPERAVAELQGKTFVWVVGPDNKTSQRAVKVGGAIGELVLIAEGLKPGDRIVTEGLQKVREGSLVTPAAVPESGYSSPSASGSVNTARNEPAKE